MIHVTRLNSDRIIINSDLIELVESTPDTVLSLSNGQKIMVLESPEEVVRRVVDFRRRIAARPELCSAPMVDAPQNAHDEHGRN